ncbi:hypothetical protein Taro_040749, partial [Colocasia esculenta]|nr:hypothetical protein [Colocasia esculenta]
HPTAIPVICSLVPSVVPPACGRACGETSFLCGCSVSLVVTPVCAFPYFMEVWDGGACVVRLWSDVVAPVFHPWVSVRPSGSLARVREVASFLVGFECELQESVVAVVGCACYERGRLLASLLKLSRCFVCSVAPLVEHCDTFLWLLSALCWLVVNSGEVLPEFFSVGYDGIVERPVACLLCLLSVGHSGWWSSAMVFGVVWCTVVTFMAKRALCFVYALEALVTIWCVALSAYGSRSIALCLCASKSQCGCCAIEAVGFTVRGRCGLFCPSMLAVPCMWLLHHVLVLEWFVFVPSGALVHCVVPWVAPDAFDSTVCCAMCPDRELRVALSVVRQALVVACVQVSSLAWERVRSIVVPCFGLGPSEVDVLFSASTVVSIPMQLADIFSFLALPTSDVFPGFASAHVPSLLSSPLFHFLLPSLLSEVGELPLFPVRRLGRGGAGVLVAECWSGVEQGGGSQSDVKGPNGSSSSLHLGGPWDGPISRFGLLTDIATGWLSRYQSEGDVYPVAF